MPDRFPRESGGSSSRLTFNFMHKGLVANVSKPITVSVRGGVGKMPKDAEPAHQTQRECGGGASVTPHTARGRSAVWLLAQTLHWSHFLKISTSSEETGAQED